MLTVPFPEHPVAQINKTKPRGDTTQQAEVAKFTRALELVISINSTRLQSKKLEIMEEA